MATPKLRVGQEVDFKVDIEGHGKIIAIEWRQGMFDRQYTYVIGCGHPTYEQWHIAARDSDKYGQAVVRIDGDYKIWPSSW